jgi:hypothetical protein
MLKNNLKTTLGAGVFLSLLTVSTSGLFGQEKASATEHSRGILYLTGAYEFAEVDLKTDTAKTRPIAMLAGIEAADVCDSRHPPQSCDWHASETRLDLQSRRMYFVTPAANPGDEPEEGQEEAVAEQFVVWVVGLGDLKPIKKIEVPFAQQNMPTILLIQDGKKLLVSYKDEDGKSRDVDTIDTATFAKISTAKDSSGDIENTYFPAEAYFAPSGKFIVVGDDRIWMEKGQFRSEYLDPRAKLPAEEQKKLSGFLKTQQDGRKLLIATSQASLNGVTLEMVLNDAETESAFWTIDMETGASSPAITPKYFAKAELIGRGEEMALFEGSMKPPTQGGPRLERTGHVAIYDVKSGAMVREFNVPELKGAGELLCTSADGSMGAYGHGRAELLILDLKTGHVTRVAGKFNELPPPKYIGACAFGE